MDVILFLVFATIAVVCAINVVVQSHPISSALSLVGVMGSLAVLFLLLGNVRSALIVAITIPFALLFAAIMLDLRHIPANLLSLGALDFGMVVAAAEAAVGLAIILTVFKNRSTLNIDEVNSMKN